MSDEDIKVKLEEMIEFFADMGILTQTERTKMLEKISNLIDKQKEIEELNEIKQQICNEELITQDYVQENFISKDKIREKIKEVSNGTYDAKIILEKLLEE